MFMGLKILTMEKRLSFCAPEESLHDNGRLEQLGKGQLDDAFRISHIHESATAFASSTLVSASLFNERGQVSVPSSISAEWFDENIIPGPPAKYYDALLRRHEFYSGTRMRLYISGNLEALVPWLFDLGFDEVYVMANNEAGFMPGMLWRYLPIHDDNFEWVVCTGVDCLGGLGKEMGKPHGVAAAPLHIGRYWMAFAGPFAMRPLTDTPDVAKALSGFRQAWLHPDLATYEGQILNRCRYGEAARCCDAAFLSIAYWNRSFLTSGPRLFSLGLFEFRSVFIAPVRLGAP